MSFYLMHRGWMEHPAFAREKFTEREAWEWLISAAVWSPEGVTIAVNHLPIKLNAGQLSYSLRYLAEAWIWDKNKVSRFLMKLQKWDMVALKSGTAQLIITICNYKRFQPGFDESGTEVGQQPGQGRDRGGTNKNSGIITDIELDLFGSENFGDEPAPPEPKPKAKKSTSNGSRLDPAWELSEEWGDMAEKIGLRRNEILEEEEKFRDYWTAKTGKNATKMDWSATWRLWCRNALNYRRERSAK